MAIVSLQHSASRIGRRNAHPLTLICVVLLGRYVAMMTRYLSRHFGMKRHARPDVRGAQQYAFERLQHDLPPTLHYHALRHTRDDVLPAVERLAAMSGVTGHTLDLLRTAAVFHDLGYIRTPSGHEAVSIAIACEVLPTFGFSQQDIVAITGMIAATKLPQTPRTIAEAILADADLDSLGRRDFFIRGAELRREQAAYGTAMTEQEWNESQHRFLSGHTFHTPAAHALRDHQKLRNIAQLTRKVEQLNELEAAEGSRRQQNDRQSSVESTLS